MPAPIIQATMMQPEDILLLELQETQAAELAGADRLEYAHRVVDGGSAFTLWSDIGGRPAPMVCFGGLRLHAEYRHLWALFSRHKPRVPLHITRIARAFVAGQREKRVDLQVASSNAGACGWARMIGLELEARLAGAAADGSDMLIYVRRNG